MPAPKAKEAPLTAVLANQLEELTSSSSSSVEAWKDLGNQCFSNGSFLSAIKCYTKAITLNKDNNEENRAAVLLSNRSASYLKSSMFSGPSLALKDAEAAIKINGKWPKGYLRLGDAQFNRKKYDEAKKAYDMALSLDPNCEAAQVSLKALQKEMFLRDLDLQEKEEAKKRRAEGNDASIDKGSPSGASSSAPSAPQPLTKEEQLELQIREWSKDISVGENRTGMKPRTVSLEEADRQTGANYKQQLLGNFRKKLETSPETREVVEERIATTQLIGEGTDYRRPEEYYTKYARSTDGIGLGITADAFKDHIGTAKHW